MKLVQKVKIFQANYMPPKMLRQIFWDTSVLCHDNTLDNPTQQKLFCGFASRSVFCQHAWHSNSISNMRPPVPNSPDSRFLPAHFYINSSTKTFIKNTRGSIQWYNFFSKKPIEKIRFLSLKSRAKSLKIWKNIKKKLTKKHETKQPNFVYY